MSCVWGDVDLSLHAMNVSFACTTASCVSLALTTVHKVCVTSTPNSLLECACHTITGIDGLHEVFLQPYSTVCLLDAGHVLDSFINYY